MRSFRLDELPAGRLRSAAVKAYARSEAERIGGTAHELELERDRGTGSGTRKRTPARRTRNPRRYVCHSCGAGFAAWAPAERHADTHGGARIELGELAQ